jgi:hypothetical protein
MLLWVAIALLFNVLTQQLLLCGYIFQTIRTQTSLGVALVVSAALFSGYHASAFQGEWLPALNVFAAGLLFCLAYCLTGSLWFPISIHFAWNILLGPVLGLAVSGSGHFGSGIQVFVIQGPALFTGGAFGLEGGLVVTFTTVVGVVALLFLLQQREQKARASTTKLSG